MHFYNYDDDALDHRTYPHAKFVSEFGYQVRGVGFQLPQWQA